MDVVNSEIYILRKGQAKRDRLKMWSLVDNLQPKFNSLRLTEDQSTTNFNEKVFAFGRQYIKCFRGTHVAHYMVCQFESLYTIEF